LGADLMNPTDAAGKRPPKLIASTTRPGSERAPVRSVNESRRPLPTRRATANRWLRPPGAPIVFAALPIASRWTIIGRGAG
jgi:hypothetical protein